MGQIAKIEAIVWCGDEEEMDIEELLQWSLQRSDMLVYQQLGIAKKHFVFTGDEIINCRDCTNREALAFFEALPDPGEML